MTRRTPVRNPTATPKGAMRLKMQPLKPIAPQKDNSVQREIEIGQLGQEELQEDERARDASRYGELHNTKPSQL